MSAAIRMAKTTGRVRLQRGALAGLAGLTAGSLLLCLPAAAQAKVKATVDSTAQIQALLDHPVSGVVNLPSGTFTISPTLQLQHGEAIIGHNTTLKVAASSGDYVAVLTGATYATDLSGLSITGVTFDQNAAGDPVTDVQKLYNGQPRFVLRIPNGTGITITADKFLNTNNVNTIATGSATSKVTISGNQFTGVSLPWHDHSSIYTSGTGATITGNTFTGSHDIAAIEVHGDQAIITGNTISGYYRGINIVASDTTFTRNTITGALGPVDLWSIVAPGLHNVTVTGNTLKQNLAGWVRYLKTVAIPMPTGVQIQQVFQQPSSTFPFTQITISGNTA
jgi:Right handed beta helix region